MTTPNDSYPSMMEDAKNSLLYHLLPGIYYRSQPDSLNIQWCSAGSFVLLGFQPNELSSHESFIKLVHPNDRELFNTKLQKGDGLITMNYRLMNHHGNYKWVKDEFVSVTENHRTILEGHLTEITNIKKHWSLLRELKAYRDAIDVNIISSVTNSQGIITYVNKNFCHVSQYSEQELIGRNHSIVKSTYHAKEFFSKLWNTISSGKAWHGEILNRSKDGSHYWVNTVIIPVMDENNIISHYLSLHTLITDRKEAEKQKDEYILILEEIAFIVAHRLRGPMCNVAGLVSLLERPNESDEARRLALDYMRKAVSKIDEITHELSRLLYTYEVDLQKRNYEYLIAKKLNSDLP